MSEQQGEATNVWSQQVSQPPVPPQPRDPQHDETSASERAFAEGWPAQPGWMPEGPAPEWGAPAQPQQYEQPQQFAPPQQFPQPHQYEQPGYGQPYPAQPGQQWMPSQTAYAGTSPHGASQDPYSGYPPSGPPAYPGPDAPLPKKNNGLILGSVVGVVLLVAAAIGGVVLFTRSSGGSTTNTAATASAPPPSGSTVGGGGSTGGQAPSTTGKSGTTGNTGATGTSKSKSGSSSAGTSSGSSGSSSSGTAPMTSSTSIDLTTVHVPAYAASPDANDVAHTLDAYFTGINSGDYETAWNQFTPSLQAKNPFSQFSDATSGTIDQDVTVTDVTVRGDGTGSASVTFTSTQPPDKGVVAGQTCTNWSITYSLQLGGGAGGWLISGTPSAQHSGC